MCAINGYVNWSGIKPLEYDCVSLSLKAMTYRGPDYSEIYSDNFALLGHNRLSIVDLNARSNQPMTSTNNRFTIVFNGEIYNYKVLREELKLKGIPFISESDTEVLLNAYIEFGVNVLSKIRGMFSFVIWDKKEKKIFAARDRFGEKPFYYLRRNKKEFCFASNLSGIVQLAKEELVINNQAVHELLNQQYIDVNTCIYKGIKKMAPSSYMIISEDDIVINKYWDLNYKEKIDLDFNSSKLKVKEILNNAIEEQLEADVPVGVFLSGGTDSSIITAIASKKKKDITAITISTPDDKVNDEKEHAAYVANKLKINHKVIELNKDCVNYLPHILSTIEPIADASLIPSFAITQSAKKDFTVMLSGDGGDEVFGGYKMPITFKDNPFKGNSITTAIVNSVIKNADRPVYKYFFSKLNSKRIFKWGGLSSYYNNLSLSKSIEKTLLKEKQFFFRPQNQYLKDSLNYIKNKEDALLHVGVKSKLPNDFLFKMDSSSMLNSIETRAPFLDYRLIDFTSKLNINQLSPNKLDKEILKSIGSDYLPKEFFNLPKKGFSIPYYSYLKKEWGTILLTYTREGISADLGILNPDAVVKLLEDYKLKPSFRVGRILYSILVFEIWLRVFHLKMDPNKINLNIV
ncbi:asparagine synthase (glutamine-hydrolyzing) [uncultured Polaribacter sp.]|uniref:asparagine synthase (glutamine-hydrolyzing) n=1 Tax=uncultured Polaribacter sp. TaxID=174711 RepID=UPI00260713F4|nr:asparagine synthase (glutamine-hydrolyzing) [uncultured Polaribacter sp.]